MMWRDPKLFKFDFWIYAYLVATLICIKVAAGSGLHANSSSFALIIDAGSTGSRAFVFRVDEGSQSDASSSRRIHSQKGKKVMPGISTFNRNPQMAAEYLAPVLIDAAKLIPKADHKRTQIYIKGTAGMRLLPTEEQDAIWNAVFEGLSANQDVPFLLHRENLGTIDGMQEAFYAVLSSNYIAGSIDGNLRRIEGVPMVGALDMGGSSTQLIFHTGNHDPRPIGVSDFWSHSWLNYGVDRVRERVWLHLAENGREVTAPDAPSGQAEVSIDVSGESVVEAPPAKRVVHNPCSFKGHEHELENGIILRGSGAGEECIQAIQRTIWPAGQCEGNVPCVVDDVAHPPVAGNFYGMSVYFYALDCIRELGPKDLPHWYVNVLFSACCCVGARLAA